MVHDGFVANQAHSFPPVDIGENASAPAARRRSQPRPTDDGGSLTWLAFPGIALIAGRAAILLLRDRRRRGRGISRRRRESHHPRRRWPRLRGGGDDDRRLRRRRLRRATRLRPPRRRQPAKDGLHVWIANGCGGCHTFKAANSDAPIGPDLGRSLEGETATT